ncbi:hypothetical protein [Corynebacterium liangguodongii]|uniref:hypothetical protein n=1 Tax=Corynebacterium liangguodongii TaxID=2079535 RepID=UPI001304AF8D|nr:hypothetical protein [Corynebacterium liangguodongii]
MDRDLLARIIVCCLLVAAFLTASSTGRFVGIVGPLSVVGVAVAMFWPRGK